MPKRSYPGALVAVLGVIACSGWIVAWRAAGPAKDSSAETKGGDSAEGRGKDRGDGRSASTASFIKDPATARLLASFEEISAAAVPGKVNERLVHACRGVLMDNDVTRRERNYGLLLELMRAEDGAALHELFLELHREGRAFGEYKALAVRWGALDAQGALDFLRAQVPMVLPRDDVRALARGWGKTDPVAAMKWMGDNPELGIELSGRTSIMEGWMKTDPSSALSWLDQNRQTLQPKEYIECVRMAFPEQIHGATTDLTTATDWLAGLPDEGYSGFAALHAWNGAQWSLGELPYERAAEVWGKVGSEPWMGFREFRGFTDVHSNNRSSGEGMEGYLEALGKSWPEDKIVSQFERWTEKDPNATLEWLESAPEGTVTTAGLRGAIQALEKTDPAAAAEWARRLER